MKRLFVALSSLTLLLTAAPASALPQWEVQCQPLSGGVKKMCIDGSKASLKMDRDSIKGEFVGNKDNCESAYQTCKAACAP